jgi:hypothetical protein
MDRWETVGALNVRNLLAVFFATPAEGATTSQARNGKATEGGIQRRNIHTSFYCWC